MEKDISKPVRWIGTSYNDWKAFPGEVQDVMGYALHLAQHGKKATYVKPLKGFKGATVLEIVDDFDGNTWRAIYTVQFKGTIYVLHAFQKKSRTGIATPKTHIKLIEQRLKQAKEHYETNKA
jgi:phage-related protein